MRKIPANPPKFEYGQRVRPINWAEHNQHLEHGFYVDHIALSNCNSDEWVYWEEGDVENYEGIEFLHGFWESRLELVPEGME